MNHSAYLERIGYRGSADPTRATLDSLIERHQRAVPFENLDIVRLHRTIELDSARLFRKIVDERRGGFCYELNGLMAWLLEALGYRVTLGYGCWPGGDGAWSAPFDHMVLSVRADDTTEPLLVDVGFGADSPVVAVPLQEDRERTVVHGNVRAYRTTPDPSRADIWRIEAKSSEGEWTLIYEADLTPRSLEAFGERCAHMQTSPESHFTQSLLCSRPLDNGRVTMGGRRFILTTGDVRSERPLAGLDDELALLRSWFGIEVDPAQYREER